MSEDWRTGLLRNCYKPLGLLKRLDLYLKILCKLEGGMSTRHDQLQEMTTPHNAFFLKQSPHLLVYKMQLPEPVHPKQHNQTLPFQQVLCIILMCFKLWETQYLWNWGFGSRQDLQKSIHPNREQGLWLLCLDIMNVDLLPSEKLYS